MLLAALAGYLVWRRTEKSPDRAWEEFFPEDLHAFVTVELGPEKAALVRASALYSILTDREVMAYAREMERPGDPFLRLLDGVESAAVGLRTERAFFGAKGPPGGLDAVIKDALDSLAGRGEKVSDYAFEEYRGKRGRSFAFLEVPSAKKFALGGSGRGEAEGLVGSFLKPPERTLKDSELYANMASLMGSEGVVRGFADAGFLVDKALARAAALGEGERAQEFARAAGFDRLTCLSFSSTFDGPAAHDRLALSFDKRAGIFGAARKSDLSLIAETYVPKSAIVFAAFSADPAYLLAALGESKGAGLEGLEGLKGLSKLLGVDMTGDLLPALGNEFAFFVLPGLAMGRERNVGFILKPRDPRKVEEAVEKAAAAASVWMPRLTVDKIEYQGVTVRYFELPGWKLTPALAITDDAVLFGFSDAVVRRMLHTRAQGKGATLASIEELRPMLERARSASAVWCVAGDQLAGELFGLAAFRLDAKKAAFPMDAVVEKLFTGWGAASIESTHMRIESHCPFGVPAFLVLGASGPEPAAEEGEIF